MDDKLTHLRMEVGISKRDFVNYIQLHNKDIEEQIDQGLSLAIEDIVKEDTLKEFVATEVQTKVYAAVKEAIDEKITLLTNAIVKGYFDDNLFEIRQNIKDTLKQI